MEFQLIKTSEFKFRTKLLKEYEMELPFSEHTEELRQRFFQLIYIFLFISVVIFTNVTVFVKILESPVQGIKFIQLSPGEYLISTIKITIYSGLLICIPLIICQLIFFMLPGLTKNEKKFILPIIGISFLLFGLGLGFSYYLLIPAALKFFVDYSSTVIEPFWSFDQYLDFILLIFYSTGLAFQIPIIQLILGLTKIISAQQMLSIWKYVILGSTIIGAILTPSTDPITQVTLSSAIVMLYFLGANTLLLYEK
jgi:sec-independent protein translocase protein TatC